MCALEQIYAAELFYFTKKTDFDVIIGRFNRFHMEYKAAITALLQRQFSFPPRVINL